MSKQKNSKQDTDFDVLKHRLKYRLRRNNYLYAPVSNAATESFAATFEARDDTAKIKEETKILKDRLLRALADNENQRKRFLKEKEELRNYVTDDIVTALLPAIDNLNHAVDAAKTTDNAKALHEGVGMVRNDFTMRLGQINVEIIDKTNVEFDPNIHEAVEIEKIEEGKENIVVGIIRKGYKIKDRIIRAAMVKVTKLNN